MSRMHTLFLALLLIAPIPAPSFIYQDPAADQAIRRAMSATYSLDLADARRAARILQGTHPDHPVGFVLEGETYWWEAQIDPTRDDIEDKFFTIQDKAISIGEKALKARKYPTVEIQAYLASAWGSKARFRLTQSGVGLRTVMDGRNAHNYAEEVYKADPMYTDILVGIGAYNYFTGKIPAVLRPFAYLLGASGDPVLGLQQMRTAAEKGRYARTEAKIVLFTALMKDGAYADSFKVLQGLMSEYPANHALYAWVTEWYLDQGKKAEGIAYFEKFQADKLPSSTKLAQYALFQKAILQAENEKNADALATLRRVRMMGTPEAALGRTVAAMERALR
jgi:tetratricopeptide (TPR) repeat protein